MARISTCLNFPRNTEEAFNFYKSVFGGDFIDGKINRFGEIPSMEGMPPLPEEDKNQGMHVAIKGKTQEVTPFLKANLVWLRVQYGHWVTYATATAIICFVFSESAPSLKTAFPKLWNASDISGARAILFS